MTADPIDRPSDRREEEVTPSRRRRRTPLWRDFYWTLLSVSALAVVGFGVTGFLKTFGPPLETASQPEIALRWIDALYRTIQLFVLEFNPPANHVLVWELQLARFAAPVISVFAAVKALLVVFRDQADLLRLRFLRGHVIVCGLGQRGLFLIDAFRSKGHKVVAIDAAGPRLASCRETGSLVLEGDATHPDILRKAGVKKARWLISVMDDDPANAEVAVQIRRLVRRRDSSPLTCAVQVNDPELWMLLREGEFRAQKPDAPVRLEFFNIFETAARVMLDLHPPFPAGVDRSSVRPHLVLVGLGRLGQSVLIRAARDWRLRVRGAGGRPLVTVLDRDAKAKVDMLHARHPDLRDSVDIDCLQTEVGSPELVQALVHLSRFEATPVTTVYVCLGDDSLSLVVALAIQLRMRQEGRTVPMVAGVSDELGLARLLPGGDADVPSEGRLRLFGLMNRAYSMELLTGGINESMARVLHAVYLRNERARETADGDRPALIPWEELSERFREQNREQADSISRQIEGAGYRIVPLVDWDAWSFRFPEDVVDRLARAEHDRWLRRATRSGYRQSEFRDERRKKTPSLVDWKELTEDDKEKDRNFVRWWPETLFLAGLQIERADPARPGGPAPFSTSPRS